MIHPISLYQLSQDVWMVGYWLGLEWRGTHYNLYKEDGIPVEVYHSCESGEK